MTTTTSRTFRSGNSEAVRLPKAVAYGRNIEVTIVRSGDVITISPKRPPIQDAIAQLRALPKAPERLTRDVDVIPEREGFREE